MILRTILMECFRERWCDVSPPALHQYQIVRLGVGYLVGTKDQISRPTVTCVHTVLAGLGHQHRETGGVDWESIHEAPRVVDQGGRPSNPVKKGGGSW